MTDSTHVGLAPFHAGGSLQGFVITGRWPDTTKEWAQVLVLAVRVATMPGLLATTTVFGTRDEIGERPLPGTVGLVVAEGRVLGDAPITPGQLANRTPSALFMLHPPSETQPSLPECAGAASGCVLLPGVPHLGLEHRAVWAEADRAGTVTALASKVGLDPIAHPDTALLHMMLAA